MDRDEICDHWFVRIGNAELVEDGKLIPGSNPPRYWFTAWRLVDERFWLAEESVYIIKENGVLIYVGVYGNTLKSRMAVNGRYVWHADKVSDHIKDALHRGADISLWLMENPYYRNAEGNEINASHSLEIHLLRNLERTPLLNAKTASTNKKRYRVLDLLTSE